MLGILFGYFGEAFGVEENDTIVVLLKESGHVGFDVFHCNLFEGFNSVEECLNTIDFGGCD